MKTLAFALLALTACVDDNPELGPEADRVEGIYRVDAHVMNQTSCATGGESVGDTHKFAFAKRVHLQGVTWLQIYSCASLEACRDAAAATQFEGVTEFDFALTDHIDHQLIGQGASTGYSDGAMCRSPEAWETTLELVGDALHISRAIRVGADYEAQAGYCTTELGSAAADDAPCSKRESLDAKFLERL